MNSEAPGSVVVAADGVTSGAWSRRRWWTLVGLVFAAQLGFFFAFGNRQPVRPRGSSPVTVLNLGQSEDEWLALNDPTMFALPNAHGVAGQAWSSTPAIPFTPFRLTLAPRLLGLQFDDPGGVFARFLPTNVFTSPAFETKPDPEGLPLTSPGLITPTVTNSTVRLTEALAARRWLNAPTLRSWTGTQLLTNTVVQAVVLPEGRVFSATLLVPPGPNDRPAAAYALQVVAEARFAPVPDATGPTLGKLIFEWHVEPPAAAPPSTPESRPP